MRRIVLALAMSAIATMSIFAGSAAASGPAAPGKELVEAQCVGLGTITASIPKGEKNKGAAQIVGQTGHGIPVSVTFTLTDVTTSTVVEIVTPLPVVPGRAQSGQTTTTCTGTAGPEVPASVLFEGHELPVGVAPTDIIHVSLELQAIIKP